MKEQFIRLYMMSEWGCVTALPFIVLYWLFILALKS